MSATSRLITVLNLPGLNSTHSNQGTCGSRGHRAREREGEGHARVVGAGDTEPEKGRERGTPGLWEQGHRAIEREREGHVLLVGAGETKPEKGRDKGTPGWWKQGTQSQRKRERGGTPGWCEQGTQSQRKGEREARPGGGSRGHRARESEREGHARVVGVEDTEPEKGRERGTPGWWEQRTQSQRKGERGARPGGGSRGHRAREREIEGPAQVAGAGDTEPEKGRERGTLGW